MMQMGGLPAGDWSPLLVGHQWPSDSAVATLGYWKENREYIAVGHNQIADLLHDAQTGPLAMQEGMTADALRRIFGDGDGDGEQRALGIAGKNFTKMNGHATTLDGMHSLRHELSDFAAQGNKEIKEIQNSKEPAEMKTTQILAAIGKYQQQANLAASKYGSNIIDAGQRFLNEEDTDQSFHQITQAGGLDTTQLFRSRDLQDPVLGRTVGFADSVVGLRDFLGLIGARFDGLADGVGGHPLLDVRIKRPQKFLRQVVRKMLPRGRGSLPFGRGGTNKCSGLSWESGHDPQEFR